MSFLFLKGIRLALGERDLLQDVSLQVHSSSRLGLVGANGCGKTTLLEIMTGERVADSGAVQRSEGLRLGYLKQTAGSGQDVTVMATAQTGFSDLERVFQEKEFLAERLDGRHDAKKEKEIIASIHDKEEHLAASGWWEKETTAAKVLSGLGFSTSDFNRSLAEFSGGWKTRAYLAATLLQRADILLLDEPTNYLDLEATEWLLGYLQAFCGGLVLVSHDRDFLDRLTTSTAEIFMGRIKVYSGSYSSYEEARALELEQSRHGAALVVKHAARLESFIQRFRYKSSKAAQVQSRLLELAKLPEVAIPPHLKRIHLKLPPPPHCGKWAIRLEGAGKSYGERTVFKALDLAIRSGEKVAVAGKNGSGKTTLLRLLAGRDPGHWGRRVPGSGLCTGYFAQEFEDLDPNLTVFQTCTRKAAARTDLEVSNALGAFLFSGDDLTKKVRVLSGGERNRLVMAGLLLGQHNLLVLDEPTNHLDMASKEILLEALDVWEGTVVFVSHDRFFLRSLAQRVLYLEDGTWTDYPGNWEGWETVLQGRTVVRPTSPVSNVDEKRRMNKERQTKLRKLEKEEQILLERVTQGEARLKELEAEMAKQGCGWRPEAIQGLRDSHAKLETDLKALQRRWEETASEWELLNASDR